MIDNNSNLINRIGALLARIDAHCRMNNPILYALRADAVVGMLGLSALISALAALSFLLNSTTTALFFSLMHFFILVMMLGWTQSVQLRRYWQSWTFACVFNYRFSYVCTAGLIINFANLFHIPFLIFLMTSVPRDGRKLTIETAITLTTTCYAAVLLIIIMMALTLHASAVKDANNERIEYEYKRVFAALFFFAFLVGLCAAFSLESRAIWQDKLSEWLFNIIDYAIVFKFRHLLFVVYAVEGATLAVSIYAVRYYWLIKGKTLSSRDCRQLQVDAVSGIVISLAILTHWTLMLLPLSTLGGAILFIIILSVISITLIDLACRLGEPMVMGPWT